VGRDCSQPNPATRTSTESALPVARTLPAEGILGAVKGTAALTSEPILVHSAAHTPRESASGAFPSLAWIGCSQWLARQRSSVQPVAACAVRSGILAGGTRLQHSACGCNTVHVVATHFVCCCVTPVLRRGRCHGGQQWRHRCGRGHGLGCGADVGWARLGQMWAGDGLFRSADVGRGWTQSQCRCG
jgi:hypothetical protein